MEWWMYGIIAVSMFFGFVALNYIVKRINEASLEDRLRILNLKQPVGQVTQVQETALELKTLKPTLSQGRLITIKASVVDEAKTNAIKGKESEEPSVHLGTIYMNSGKNNVTEINRTEVIELTDVAQSAQLSIEKSESEVYASTLNEFSNITGPVVPVVLLNDVLQKDLVLSIVDENKTLTVGNAITDVRPQNCSKLVLPDLKIVSEVREEESEKTKPNTSTSLSENQ